VRNNTNPRTKCWLLLFTLSMAVCVFSSNASIAGEAETIGKPLPSGAEPSSIPAGVSIPEPPQLQSLEVGLPVKRISEALSAISSDKEAVTTRGATESGVYQKAAPGVVLVVTEDGFGSGSYIGSNRIITNWHVVGELPKVTVVFLIANRAFPPL
jgi:S1-C subfamily serine protease